MFIWSNKVESKAKSNKNNKKEYKIDEFSDDITCDICLEQYSTDQNDLKSPRILKCGHTRCLECLSKEFEKHNKTIIKCPYDSQDTRLESLSDLTVNVVIIGTIINYDFYKQEMINKYQNQIDQLQEEIGKEIHVNLKQLEETWDKLNMHLISIYSVKSKVLEVIDGLKKIKNQDTQLLFNLEEYKKLENYLNELKTNETFYKKQLKLVEIRLAKLNVIENVIENDSKKTDKIQNIQKLVDYHIYILRLKEYVKEILEDDRINKSFEGLSTLNEIEEKIMNRLKEIEQNFNVEQLLRYIKNKSEGNHKAYRIGILGLMSKFLFFFYQNFIKLLIS